jgi:hypothetical protein
MTVEELIDLLKNEDKNATIKIPEYGDAHFMVYAVGIEHQDGEDGPEIHLHS